MGYVYLLITIVFETVAVIFMKLSSGFTNKPAAIVAVISYVLGFVFLTFSLRLLPAGVANAIWAGASTVLVAVCSIWIFREHLTVIQWVSLLLIIVGIIGLQTGSASAPE